MDTQEIQEMLFSKRIARWVAACYSYNCSMVWRCMLAQGTLYPDSLWTGLIQVLWEMFTPVLKLQTFLILSVGSNNIHSLKISPFLVILAYYYQSLYLICKTWKFQPRLRNLPHHCHHTLQMTGGIQNGICLQPGNLSAASVSPLSPPHSLYTLTVVLWGGRDFSVFWLRLSWSS